MSQTDDLDARKTAIGRKYLGKGGIHGVGLARSKSALKIYVDATAGPDLQELLEAIRQDATPFAVLVVREDRASKRG